MKYQKKDRRDDERRPRKSTSNTNRSNTDRTKSSRSRISNNDTDRPVRSSSTRDKFERELKPRERRSSSDFNDRSKKSSFKENSDRPIRRTNSDFNEKPRERRSDSKFNERPKRANFKENTDRPSRRTSSDFNEKPRVRRTDSEFTERVIERKTKSASSDRAKRFNSEKTKRASKLKSEEAPVKKSSKNITTSFSKKSEDDLIRLNRYISNSGICSRRKADELILNGEVSVNGEVIKELGYKVKISDKIKFQGKLLKPGNLEYILLNKPKDFITTTDDPLERKTVMDLIRNASTERVYPVGRLDRNTTGLLLFTNDGDLADRLAHPRNQVRKIYEVELDKSLSASDFEKIKEGLELEDGPAKVDAISYLDGKAKKHVGVEIHIGRNRIVRRIFESLGYEVVKLDRVVYAGLTKKDLPRGRFRHLTKEEIIYLKHLNKY